MAKNSVNSLVSDIKILGDYNVSDSDLETLLIAGINFAIKRMKQWFMDEGLFDEIGAHDSFFTTANQEYVDIATETIDFDQPVILSERTNDSPITIITFKEYRERYSDPTANKSSTPDFAAFFANRVYFAPTPNAVLTIYLDYIKLITKVVVGGTLPYEDKYDELIVAIAIQYLIEFLDRDNTNAITQQKNKVDELKHDLIVGATKNIGMNQQVESRRGNISYFSPRKVT